MFVHHFMVVSGRMTTFCPLAEQAGTSPAHAIAPSLAKESVTSNAPSGAADEPEAKMQHPEVSPRVGLLGELETELQLVKHGWHPVRLDTAQMASNADIIAIKHKKRVAIQIKTTNSQKLHSHSQWLGFGYATGYLRDKKAIFNSKESPLIADVIIAVSYRDNLSRFVILPVALAERLCRIHADYWYGVPARKRLNGKMGKRSTSFPIYLCFTANTASDHRAHAERMKRNIVSYENRWDVLQQPIDKLHDRKAWPVLR
jgi:hypothetical protein